LLIENIIILFENPTSKAEVNMPICEKAIKVLGPYLLYKKDIGREPIPKQKLAMLKIRPTFEALSEK
tara:strand:- start:993 stop:1193 length:201 start_codon:yes stop_codon:yes gene_type:complete